MSDYVQITSFAPKDALSTGTAAKRIKGTEIDPELSAISTAIASKYDSADTASNAEAAALTSTAKLITPGNLAYALVNGAYEVPDANLSANIPLKNAANIFAATQTVTDSINFTITIGLGSGLGFGRIRGTVGTTLALGGNDTDVMHLHTGARVGAPTGGDKGAGTINVASGYYVNDVAVPLIDGTGASGTWGINVTGNAATATLAANSSLLQGWDYTAFATASHAHAGGDITSGTVAKARIDADVYRGTLGSGNIVVQSGGSPSGGSNGDIWLIY
jgi:hypothetical protein